jgi:hypothetical protein
MVHPGIQMVGEMSAKMSAYQLGLASEFQSVSVFVKALGTRQRHK